MSKWCFDNCWVQGIQAFQPLSIALDKHGKSSVEIRFKKIGNSCCPDKYPSGTRNEVIECLCNQCAFHSHTLKAWLEKCMNVFKSAIANLTLLPEGISWIQGTYRYPLWSLFLCSFFLQATNRAFLFSFFTISDVHYSYGLFFLAVKISHSRSHSGSRFLLYLNLKGLLSLCPFPSLFPSLLFESCVNIFEKGKIKM